MNLKLKRKTTKLLIAFIVCVVIIASYLSQKSAIRLLSGCEVEFHTVYTSPLTYEKFTAITQSEDQVASCEIMFRYVTADKTNRLYISSDKIYLSWYLNTFENFPAVLVEEDRGVVPTIYKTTRADFSLQEIQNIFDYLHTNNEYFFDNSEFDGQTIPIENEKMSWGACSSEFSFSLGFREPNTSDYVWAISKCLDDYPAPDHPLYDLFEILIDDFASQCEPGYP